MGLMQRLDRLDERAGLVDRTNSRISVGAIWREMFTYPLLPWFLVAVGVGILAVIVFEPFGVPVAVLAIGLVTSQAGRRIRQAQEIASSTASDRGTSV